MKKILIGNWKMHKKRAEALSYCASLNYVGEKDVRIAAPYTHLLELSQAAERLGVKVGAQNMHAFSEGAFTGEISAGMLKDVGAQFVLLGHSERRHLFHETNEEVAKKVERAVVEGLKFVLCVGETLEERDLGKEEGVIQEQIETAFSSLGEEHMKGNLIAYEPVWAIGSGRVPNLLEIRRVHQSIRERLGVLFSGEFARTCPILYGGSVTLGNFEELINETEIGGLLVGGASLDPNQFNEMIDLL